MPKTKIRVTVVEWSDGSTPMYFIDGVRDRGIQDDRELLDKIVGMELQYVERIWITSIDQSNPEPWEDLWYTEHEEDLYSRLHEYPELEDK